MKIVFMGTPDFSVPTLEAIVAAGHDVVAVVTQEDKPRGRGKEVQYTPVKQAALANGIEVYQPHRVREEEFVNILREIEPDVIVVVAFGQILPKSILEMPKYGCINGHASLLPRLRGAAPIQWSIIDGDKETGITTMFMDVGLDTGDMLDTVVIPIEDDETGGSLFDKLSVLSGKLMVETLEKLEKGTAIRTKQDDSLSTYAKMIDKKLGDIDFTTSAVQIERLIRGLNPWPSAYTKLNDKTIKIWKASVSNDIFDGIPGDICNITDKGISVITGEGTLIIEDLQLEGKKRMNSEDFLRGYSREKLTHLGK